MLIITLQFFFFFLQFSSNLGWYYFLSLSLSLISLIILFNFFWCFCNNIINMQDASTILPISLCPAELCQRILWFYLHTSKFKSLNLNLFAHWLIITVDHVCVLKFKEMALWKQLLSLGVVMIIGVMVMVMIARLMIAADEDLM